MAAPALPSLPFSRSQAPSVGVSDLFCGPPRRTSARRRKGDNALSSPSRNLLDREAPAKLVEQHLRAQCDMLKELADYGAELIWRAYDASAKQLTEAIAIGVLLKQVPVNLSCRSQILRCARIVWSSSTTSRVTSRSSGSGGLSGGESHFVRYRCSTSRQGI